MVSPDPEQLSMVSPDPEEYAEQLSMVSPDQRTVEYGVPRSVWCPPIPNMVSPDPDLIPITSESGADDHLWSGTVEAGGMYHSENYPGSHQPLFLATILRPRISSPTTGGMP